MMDTGTNKSGSFNLKDEALGNLLDVFKEFGIDEDIIRAVHDECDGDINKASEKLFELFGEKDKKRRHSEENDLAVIACSLLSSESNPRSTTSREITPDEHKDTPPFEGNNLISPNLNTLEGSMLPDVLPQQKEIKSFLSKSGDSAWDKKTPVLYSLENLHANDCSKVLQCKSVSEEILSQSNGNQSVNIAHVKPQKDELKTVCGFTSRSNLSEPSVISPYQDGINLIGQKMNNSSGRESEKEMECPFSKSNNSAMPSGINSNIPYVIDETTLDGVERQSDFGNPYFTSTVTSEWDAFYKQLDVGLFSDVQPGDIDVNEVLSSSIWDLDMKPHLLMKTIDPMHSKLRTGEAFRQEQNSCSNSPEISIKSGISSSRSSMLSEVLNEETFGAEKEVLVRSNASPPLLPRPLQMKSKAIFVKNVSDAKASSLSMAAPLKPMKTSVELPKKKKRGNKNAKMHPNSILPGLQEQNKIQQSGIEENVELQNTSYPFHSHISSNVTATKYVDSRAQRQLDNQKRKRNRVHEKQGELFQNKHATAVEAGAVTHTQSGNVQGTKRGLLENTYGQDSTQQDNPSLSVAPESTLFQTSPHLNTKASLSSRLPPSLTKQQCRIMNTAPGQPSTSLSSLKEMPPARGIQNKLNLRGVKTAIGLLRSYITEKQPVMFILRGLPGSGKSFLAQQLVSECLKQKQHCVVLSTDDFFSQNSQYVFNREHLPEAHDWNKQRALNSVKQQESPIVIDNTNAVMWELLPYAEMAKRNDYDIHILEPDTTWRKNVKELTRKNIHGVPFEQIKKMKSRYEEIQTEDVLQKVDHAFNKRAVHLTVETKSSPGCIPETSMKSTLKKQLKENVPVYSQSCGTAGQGGSSLGKTNFPEMEDLGVDFDWIEAKCQRTNRRHKDGKREKMVTITTDVPAISPEFVNQAIKKAFVNLENESGIMPDVRVASRKCLPSTGSFNDSRKLQETVGTDVHVMSTNVPFEEEAMPPEISQTLNLKGVSENDKMKNAIPEMPVINDVSFQKMNEIHGKGVDVFADADENYLEKKLRDDLNESGSLDTNSVQGLEASSSTSDSYYTCLSSEGDQETNQQFMTAEKSSKSKHLKVDCDQLNSDIKVEDMNTEVEVVPETPATVVDIIEFIQARPQEYELTEKDNQVTLEKYLTPPKLPALSLIDKFYRAKSKDDPLQTSDDKTLERKEAFKESAKGLLPESAFALVDYSDSEAEETVTCNVENDFPSSTYSNVEINAVKDLVSTQRNEGVESTRSSSVDRSIQSATSSMQSSRENSPHVRSDNSAEPEKSSAKAKKKRVRKGRNPGPFLAEALQIRSKTENWSSFIEKPQEKVSVKAEEGAEKKPSSNNKQSRSAQCDPYYFSLVYRLNSQAFNNHQPLDVSVTDVQVIHSSVCDSLIPSRDSGQQIYRKSETCDKSASTEESMETEDISLDTLESCFPVYSRQQLNQILSDCHGDVEWACNLLLDSPVFIDAGGEDTEEESNEETVQQTSALKSLADLCRHVVKRSGNIDADDLEMQVIYAGKTRLQEMRKFCWHRIHSLTERSDNEVEDDYASAYLDEMSEECWEWVPNQITPEKQKIPFHFPRLSPKPLSEFSNFPSYAKEEHDWVVEEEIQVQHGTVPFIELVASNGSAPSPTTSPSVEQEHLERDYVTTLSKGSSQVELCVPAEFIRSLEQLYGSLNTEIGKDGLVLDDLTARKVYNCLKLQCSKKERKSTADQMLKTDELIAKALQEEENSKVVNATASPNNSLSGRVSNTVPGWTETKPSWMCIGTESASRTFPVYSRSLNREQKGEKSGQNINSVSSTLHKLRGTSSKKLKPQKFLKTIFDSHQASSVWSNRRKGQAETLTSIMEEEKARENRHKEHLQKLQASGDVDALTTKIKREQLYSIFPSVNQELLEETFISHEYNLESTIQALELLDIKKAPVSKEMEEAMIRESLLRPCHAPATNDEFQIFPLEMETLSYDDLRKEAQLYSNLARDCQQKAQRYQRDSMSGAALFYRQEVKKYREEAYKANHRAAQVLYEKGSERLKKENVLDLHFYHIDEAIAAVNEAIATKEAEYNGRKSSCLNIITGRGKNSKFGTPKLKPAIMNHLHDRLMKFEEASPGMLKVHLCQRVTH